MKKTDFDEKLKNLNNKVTSNKTYRGWKETKWQYNLLLKNNN